MEGSLCKNHNRLHNCHLTEHITEQMRFTNVKGRSRSLLWCGVEQTERTERKANDDFYQPSKD